MNRLQVLAQQAGGAQELVLARHETARETADRPPLVRDRAEYERLHKWSIDDPQDFWAHMAHDTTRATQQS